ncbi:MAG: hypothetical protein ABJV60_04690 [Lentilitoribacter sp.]
MSLNPMSRLLGGTALATLLLPLQASADPTASIAFSWVFGEGFAIGAKAFSNDESGEAAATIGLDYIFSAEQFRPNIGVAYLDDDFFVDLNIGVLNSDFSEVNFGIGVGPIDSDDDDGTIVDEGDEEGGSDDLTARLY